MERRVCLGVHASSRPLSASSLRVCVCGYYMRMSECDDVSRAERPMVFSRGEQKMREAGQVTGQQTGRGVCMQQGRIPRAPGCEHYERLVWMDDGAPP